MYDYVCSYSDQQICLYFPPQKGSVRLPFSVFVCFHPKEHDMGNYHPNHWFSNRRGFVKFVHKLQVPKRQQCNVVFMQVYQHTLDSENQQL